MSNRYWGLFAIILLTLNPIYAATADTKAVVSPAPLFKDPVTGMEMIYVKGGCYQMGASIDDCDAKPEERPAHEVCVDDFYLGKNEVTQRQWKTVMVSNTSSASTSGGDNCPVDNVSWSEIQVFISKVNNKSEGRTYRLPTEAEWEYAARSGGKNEKYSGGNNVDTVAWYGKNSGKINHTVGTKAPNGLGLYDMSGNVWEMVNDWYGNDYYTHSPHTNPAGPSTGVDRVIRGGCRIDGALSQRATRRMNIYSRTGSDRGDNVGFRLLMTP